MFGKGSRANEPDSYSEQNDDCRFNLNIDSQLGDDFSCGKSKGAKKNLVTAVVFTLILGVILFNLFPHKETQRKSEGIKNVSPTENQKENINRYYYDNLSTREKEIYRAIDEKVENMPENIELPKESDSQEVKNAINAVTADNPIYMMLDSSTYTITSRGRNRTLSIGYSLTKAEYQKRKEKVNNKIEEIVFNMPQNLSEWEKELYIHDYIINNCVYKLDDIKSRGTAYGALIKGEAVCEGYAEAAKLLMSRVGIECITVTGIACDKHGKENHMWNEVKLPDGWYFLDLTWDDPQGKIQILTRKYFNLTSCETQKSHIPDVKVPLCYSNKYNYFNITQKCFDTYDYKVKEKLYGIFLKEHGSRIIEIKFSNEKAYNDACKGLFDDGDIFSIISKVNRNIRERKIIKSRINFIQNKESNIILIFLEYEK